MFIAFLLIWIAAFAVTIIKCRDVLLKPLFWFIMANSFIIGMFYTSGFEYRFPLKMTGLLYFVGLCATFAAGYILAEKGLPGRLRTKKGGPDESRLSCERKLSFDKNENKLNRSFLFLMAALGFVVYIADFFLHNSLSDPDLHVSVSISTVGVIGKIMSLSGILLWLYDCVYAVENDKKIPIDAFAAAAFYMMPALLTSGRQSMIIFIAATASALGFTFLRHRKYRYMKHILIVVACIFVLLIGFCVYVAVFRQYTTDKTDVFEDMFSCTVSKGTIAVLNKTGFLKSLILEVVGYYSHEMPMFQLFFDNWNGPYYLGTSQLTVISQNLPAGSSFHYDRMWAFLQNIADKNGVYSHTWRSFAANFIIDFGFVGAFFVVFAVGFLIGWLYRRAIRRRRVYDTVLLSMICAGMFFSMQYSPLAEGYWTYPMLWLCIGFPVIAFVLKKAEKIPLFRRAFRILPAKMSALYFGTDAAEK